MKRFVWVLVLGTMAASAGLGVEVAEASKTERAPAVQPQKMPRWSGYVHLFKVETIAHKLGEGTLTDEQTEKIKALREATMTKVKEWLLKTETQEAQENLTKAKASGDAEALTKAEAALKEVGDGQQFIQEYRDGLAVILSQEQWGKLFPPKKTAGGEAQ